MARGVLYVMTTVVDGLIIIGKTGSSNFESRMYSLERNGYANVTGLKREFAIEVEDYSEKEKLLDTIFEKSNVPGTELFALDVNLVVQLLSSFEGTIVFPKTEKKEVIFENATDNVEKQEDLVDKKSRFRFSEVKIPVDLKNDAIGDDGKLDLSKLNNLLLANMELQMEHYKISRARKPIVEISEALRIAADELTTSVTNLKSMDKDKFDLNGINEDKVEVDTAVGIIKDLELTDTINRIITYKGTIHINSSPKFF